MQDLRDQAESMSQIPAYQPSRVLKTSRTPPRECQLLPCRVSHPGADGKISLGISDFWFMISDLAAPLCVTLCFPLCILWESLNDAHLPLCRQVLKWSKCMANSTPIEINSELSVLQSALIREKSIAQRSRSKPFSGQDSWSILQQPAFPYSSWSLQTPPYTPDTSPPYHVCQT